MTMKNWTRLRPEEQRAVMDASAEFPCIVQPTMLARTPTEEDPEAVTPMPFPGIAIDADTLRDLLAKVYLIGYNRTIDNPKE